MTPGAGFVFEERDPLGRRIALTAATWGRHVAKRRALAGRETDVERCITAPDIIILGGEPNERFYVRRRRSEAWVSRYLQVTVQLDGDQGRVATAWFCAAPDDGVFEWLSSELLK